MRDTKRGKTTGDETAGDKMDEMNSNEQQSTSIDTHFK